MHTHIAGIPCEVEIDYYPGTHRLIHSASLEPNDPEEFEIVAVKDRNGRPAPWLANKLTADDEQRIYNEFKRNI